MAKPFTSFGLATVTVGDVSAVEKDRSFVRLNAVQNFTITTDQTSVKNTDGRGITHATAVTDPNYSMSMTISEFPPDFFEWIGGQVTRVSGTLTPSATWLSRDSVQPITASVTTSEDASRALQRYNVIGDTGVDYVLVELYWPSGETSAFATVYSVSGLRNPLTSYDAMAVAERADTVPVTEELTDKQVIWAGTLADLQFFEILLIMPFGENRGISATSDQRYLKIRCYGPGSTTNEPTQGQRYVAAYPLYNLATGYQAAFRGAGTQSKVVAILAEDTGSRDIGVSTIHIPKVQIRLSGDQGFTQQEFGSVQIDGEIIQPDGGMDAVTITRLRSA